MSKKSILFVFQNYSSFVKADFEILETEYLVQKLQFKPSKGLITTADSLVKQFFFLAINIWRYDGVYIWFADYSSLLPVLFARLTGKKSFLVIGGYDVCRLKKFHYGVFTSRLRGCFALTSMKMAGLNITVSEYVDRKVRYICPGARRTKIYNCVSLPDKPLIKKENTVLTVALLNDERTFYMKGIDLFMEVARLLPEMNFVIVGIDHSRISHLLIDRAPNLFTFEKIPHEELSSYYDRSLIYCQFSMFESFGVSIAEAMFSGCLPLVTAGGAMPEIVGNPQYIVQRDVKKIAQRIVDLSGNQTIDQQLKVRNRVKELFSFEFRKNQILTSMKNILN